MLIEDTPGYVPSACEPVRPTTGVKPREPANKKPNRQDHRPVHKSGPKPASLLNLKSSNSDGVSRDNTAKRTEIPALLRKLQPERVQVRNDMGDHELTSEERASISELNRK